MIVWLASYPRSGNGYLRAMVSTYFGYASLEMAGIGQGGGVRRDIFWRMRTTSTFEELAESPELFFVKTHNLPGDDTFPAVYMYRDGRDSLASYAWHALSKRFGLKQEDVEPAVYHDMLRMLMVSEDTPHGTWSQNLQAWLARPNTATLRFEEFIKSPGMIIDAIQQLGLGLTPRRPESLPTFDDLKEKNPTSFRRGQVGGWQDDFPPHLIPLFWQTHGLMMRKLNYGEDRESRAGAAA